MTAQTATASTVHHPFGSPSGPGLFRVKGLQLPAYIQNVAHALMAKGSLDESRAIGMAVGIVQNWAAGHDGHGHKVSADVQAAAAKAIAEWEADKARAHAHSSGHRDALELAAWPTELRGPGGQWITMGGKPVRVTKLRYRGGAGGFGHLRAIEAVGDKYQPSGELQTSPRMGPAADVYRDSMRSAARFTAARQMDHANRALDMADWAARHIGPQAQIDARRVRASLAAVPRTVSYRTNERVGAQKMRGQHPGVYRDPLNASNQQREAIALARVAPGGGGKTTSSKPPPGVAGMPSGAQVNAATGATGPRAKPASGGKSQPGGAGGSFDAKHPRIGKGNTGGGRFAAKGSGTSSSSSTAAAAKKPAAKKPAAAKAPAKKAAAGKAAPPKMNATPAKPGPAKPKTPAKTKTPAKGKPKPAAGSRAAKLAQKTQLQTQAKNDRAKARAIFTQIAQLTAAIHAAVKASAASTASTAATKTAATAAKTAAATTAAAAKTAATAATTTATTTAATTAKTTSSVPAMRAKRAGLRVQAHTLVVRANTLDKQAAAIHLTNAGPAAALELAGVPFREELARRVPAGKPGAGRFTEPGDQLTRHATPDQTAVAVNRLAPDQRAVCRATVLPPPGYEWGGADRLIPAGGAELAQTDPAIELGVRSWVHELRDRTGKWSKTGGGPQMMRPVRPPKAPKPPKAPGKLGRLSSRETRRIHARDEQVSPLKAIASALPSLTEGRSQGQAVRNAASSLSARPPDQPITAADLQKAVADAVAELRDSEKKISAEEDKRRRTKLAVHAGAIVAGAIGGYVESRTPGIPQAIAEMTAPGLLVSQELVDWARRL